MSGRSRASSRGRHHEAPAASGPAGSVRKHVNISKKGPADLHLGAVTTEVSLIISARSLALFHNV